MKIQIINCSDPHLWYNTRINETFDVYYRTKEGLEVLYWVREGGSYNALNFVREGDVKELQEGV